MDNIFLRNVFLKTLNDNRFSLLWWSIGIILFNLMVVAFYPSFGNNVGYEQLLQSLPPDLVKVFLGGFDTGPEVYLNGNLYFLVLPFIFLAFNMFFGSETIAKEEKTGSLDLVLSAPISRWKLLLEKFGAMIVLNIILGFASFISVYLGAIAINTTLNTWNVLSVSISLIGLGIFFGGLAISISAITGNRQASLGITGAVGVGAYLLNSLAPLSSNYSLYQKFSPFYYYINNDPLLNGLKIEDFSVLIIFAIIFLVIGLIIFQRRDLVTN